MENEEVSYDIEILNDDGQYLCKHVRESLVLYRCRTKRLTDYLDKAKEKQE
ncbi:MAG: hypothetical protein ACK5LL_00045 [Suipraeoptans sp.]